eukprot:CAMPEP_0197040954 /NCGR_PEP_ID=MMETSP1384-20130603/17573_1 /TAXON_ID=29189 /ORGANISM="Ammonia sp." /LENGTH=200 /DNA_ID=CAMNT_0042471797 /DNA_START=47 /DNA_END=649 /DNA_ORIENTATION=-
MGSSASVSSVAAPVLLNPVLLPVAIGSSASSLSSGSSADPNVVQAIRQTTDNVVQKWSNKEFDIKHVEIWTRAAQGSSAAVAKAAIGGVCHTFLLLEIGPNTYLLERLVEGIRFVLLDDEALESNKRLATRMYLSNDITISSKNIASWVEEKQKSEYELLSNNCIHFAYQFGVHFQFTGKLFQSGFFHFFGRARNEIQSP